MSDWLQNLDPMIFDRAKLQRPRPYRSNTTEELPNNWQRFDGSRFKSNLVIEIGCGKGHWIINEARQNPTQNFIGIEKTLNKSSVLLQQAAQEDLPNLFVIRAEAIQFIHHMIPDNSVAAFYILFPNPTPKLRQSNQRFIVGSAFHVLNQKLKLNGTIHLASNIKDYIEEAESFLMNVWNFSKATIQINSHTQNPRTAFERKYIASGESIFDLIATK